MVSGTVPAASFVRYTAASLAVFSWLMGEKQTVASRPRLAEIQVMAKLYFTLYRISARWPCDT